MKDRITMILIIVAAGALGIWFFDSIWGAVMGVFGLGGEAKKRIQENKVKVKESQKRQDYHQKESTHHADQAEQHHDKAIEESKDTKAPDKDQLPPGFESTDIKSE